MSNTVLGARNIKVADPTLEFTEARAKQREDGGMRHREAHGKRGGQSALQLGTKTGFVEEAL